LGIKHRPFGIIAGMHIDTVEMGQETPGRCRNLAALRKIGTHPITKNFEP
jgi:hypothetical protein